MRSKSRLTSNGVRRGVPLNTMCSRKCETPDSADVSSRAPVRTKKPTAMERADGLRSPMMVRPLGRTCLKNVIRLLLFPKSLLRPERPDLDETVERAGGEFLTVGAEGDGGEAAALLLGRRLFLRLRIDRLDFLFPGLERRQLLARLRLPDLHGAIFTGGRNLRAVRAERD